MVKEKRILSYFVGWLLVGLFLCFIGITKTHAATYYLNYQYYQKYYDNFGSSVSAVSTTWNESLQSYVSGNIGTTANSYGAGLAISSPIPILSNHTYTISLFFEDTNNIALSSKNHIAISTSLEGSASNYANGNYYVDMRQSNVNNNTLLQFVFTAKGHGNFIFIPWTTTYNTTQSYITTQISMEDLGSEGVSQQDINNSLNNQTNQLNQSIQNSTNTITGEINDMESAIIDSNKETQEVIKDQFNTCRDSYNLLNYNVSNQTINGVNFIVNNDKSITINGTATADTSYYLYDANNPLSLSTGTYTLSGITGGSSITYRMLMYNLNWYLVAEDTGNGRTFTVNNNTDVRLYIWVKSGTTVNTTVKPMLNEGSIVRPYEPYGEEICSNKIDETNDKLDNLQGAITDSSSPNTGALENSAGWLPAGPLDSILNLPLTMLNSLTNSLGKTCSPLNLTLPYVNKNIQIPCLSTIFAQITGVNGLWTWVGAIASVLILYNYLLNLYAWVDRVLTLRAEFDEAMGADLANWGRL